MTDFVSIFFIFKLFEKNVGGHSVSKKSQVNFRGGGGGVNPLKKSPKFKKFPTPLGGKLHVLGFFGVIWNAPQTDNFPGYVGIRKFTQNFLRDH